MSKESPEEKRERIRQSELNNNPTGFYMMGSIERNQVALSI